MLGAVFASWIRHLSERAFDGPFLELLQAHGFYDIHFSHGTFEFGKDFIAKRNEPEPVQYAFQSKAGDIGGPEWQLIRGQLEELADPGPAHPNFDVSAPLKAVLVTTGRLKGKAVVAPTAFKNRLERARRGTFEVWDESTLAELLAGSPRFPQPPTPTMAAALSSADLASTSLRDLETLLVPQWRAAPTEAAARRALVDCSVVSNCFAEKGRPFLALGALLGGVRAAAFVAHGDARLGGELLRVALDSYVFSGQRLLRQPLETPADSAEWARWIGGGPTRTMTLAVASSGIIEYLGLAALHLAHTGEQVEASRLASLCAQVVEAHPAAAHPVSDRHAASLVPAAAALAVFGHGLALRKLIRNSAKWLCDQYESDRFGLAGVYTTPAQEAQYLLGQPFEAVKLSRRNESLVAVALADIAHSLAPSEYEVVVNDLRAVHIYPSALHAKDEPAAYVMSAGGSVALVNINYPEKTSQPLAHHSLQVGARAPERIGGIAVPLAIGCLMRDRLFTDVLARLNVAHGPVQRPD